MSTVNPQQQRLDAGRAAAGRPGTLVLAIAVAAVLVVVGAAFARGLISVLDVFRIMQLNSVFAWDETPDTVMVWLLVLSVFAAVIVAGAYTRLAGRFTGGRTPAVRPFTLQALGFTAAAVVALQPSVNWWRAPSAVGVAVDPSFGRDEEWGPLAWVFYALPTVLAVGAAVLLVLSLAARIWRVRHEDGRGRLLARILAEGRAVPGTVSEVGETGLRINNVPLRRVVTAYVDHTGVRRWVTTDALIPEAETPVVGGPAEVRYLDADIAAQKNIAVLTGQALQRTVDAGAGGASAAGLTVSSSGVLFGT
ncbi:hypothetical protein [Mycetocola reblochoni]|uniref:hypothetical protein n=1 Tax=Mycetocola reblochoni TaxID=331618 RepID=UPI001180C0DF|nr:hypothetical protein [Mycetocola reblochoni]